MIQMIVLAQTYDIPERYVYRYKVMHEVLGLSGDWQNTMMMQMNHDADSLMDDVKEFWDMYVADDSINDTLFDLQVKSGRWRKPRRRYKKRIALAK